LAVRLGELRPAKNDETSKRTWAWDVLHGSRARANFISGPERSGRPADGDSRVFGGGDSVVQVRQTLIRVAMVVRLNHRC